MDKWNYESTQEISQRAIRSLCTIVLTFVWKTIFALNEDYIHIQVHVCTTIYFMINLRMLRIMNFLDQVQFHLNIGLKEKLASKKHIAEINLIHLQK